VCLVVCLLPGVVLHAGGQTPAGVTSALRVLEAALTSAPPRLQELSFATLSHYQCSGALPGDACERLVARCASHSWWEVRLMNLPNAFRAPLPRRVRRQVIEQAIRDASPHVSRAAAKLLAEHPEAWERKMLVDLSQSRDSVVRQHAAAALVRLGETPYAEVLEKALTSDDSDAALEAARHILALGTREQQPARRVLRRMLEDRDEITRANAIYGISELPNPPWDGEDIERSLADDSPMVRLAMLEALPSVRLSENGAPSGFEMALKRWGEERTPEVRVEILNSVARMESLGKVSPHAVEKFLGLALQDEEEDGPRLVAMGMLACHARPEYERRLLAVAQDPRRGLNERLVALSWLGQCHDTRVIEPLVKTMGEGRSHDADVQALRIACAAAVVRLHASPRSPRTLAPGGAGPRSKGRADAWTLGAQLQRQSR